MEIFTLDRNFKQQFIIDVFNSVIWTERYYGDSEIELVVPLSMDNIEKLKAGTFVGLTGSSEILLLETMSIENNQIKVTGISILSWLNNRIIRHSAKHEDQYWYMSGMSVGHTLWQIIKEMCTWESNWCQGQYNYGVPKPYLLGINGLTLGRYDDTGGNISVGVPYGPLYDALRDLATTYQIGMRIYLTWENDQDFRTMDPIANDAVPPYKTPYFLEFTAYRGNDRSSAQTDYPIVRFSPQTDSLNNIKEVQSATDYKTLIYTFAPSNPGGLATGIQSGVAYLTVPWVMPSTGKHNSLEWSFDVRALIVNCDDLTTDLVGTSAANLTAILNSRAADALTNHPFTVAVDGEISPKAQFKYGTDYGLGDIIEVQGNSGAVQRARVTEFIRSQDASGEKSFPSVTMFST